MKIQHVRLPQPVTLVSGDVATLRHEVRGTRPERSWWRRLLFGEAAIPVLRTIEAKVTATRFIRSDEMAVGLMSPGFTGRSP